MKIFVAVFFGGRDWGSGRCNDKACQKEKGL